jgi:TetR/AcrR family transcriptional regulator, transcriptional repressor for nem operon
MFNLWISSKGGGSMGVTKEQAANNREHILTAAARLFRQKGVDAVGLAELMKEAGFTQGGFYNHFPSKEALVFEVVGKAVDDGQQQLESAIAHSREKAIDPLTRQINWYTSRAHRDDTECGCPVAGFAAEAPHLSKAAQNSYGDALDGAFDQIATMFLDHDPKLTRKQARARAVSLYSHMVGSILLSRSVSASNPALADEILKHARSGMLAALSSPHSLKK